MRLPELVSWQVYWPAWYYPPWWNVSDYDDYGFKDIFCGVSIFQFRFWY